MKYIVYILFLCCLWNCTSQEGKEIQSDFLTKETLAAVDSIDLESKGLLAPFAVSCFDSCFVFSNIRVKNLVSILYLSDSSAIDVIYRGDGPNEILQFIPVGNHESRFLFADRVRGKVFELNLKPEYEHIQIEQFPDTIGRFFTLAMMDSIRMIGTGLFDKGRFLIYNRKDKSIEYAEAYPMNEEIRKLDPLQQAALYAGTFIAVSPDRKHLVAAYKGLLNFYSIDKNGELISIQQRYYHYPAFGIPKEGPIIAHKKEETTGFISLAYDLSYIYLLYSFTSMLSAGSETFSANTVLVYQWDGTPVMRYELDKYLLSISMDKNHNLWGVDKDHSHLYKYMLK